MLGRYEPARPITSIAHAKIVAFCATLMAKAAKRDPKKSVPAPASYMRLLLQRFATSPEFKALLLEGIDIDERDIMRPDGEVTLYTFITLSDALTRLVGETWPLDAIQAWSTPAQGALDVAVRSSATVGEAVGILQRFGHVRGPYLQISIKKTARTTALVLGSSVAMPAATLKAMSETAALSARSMIETVAADAMDQLEYHFPWPKTAYAERMQRVLGGTIKYGQPHCALVLPNTLCARTAPFADKNLLSSALSDLEAAAGRISNDDMLPIRVERLLKRKRKGRLNEDEAARLLNISRRTLVRRLSESGTSFRDLLDAHLKARAQELLERKELSRDEMAETLGFEDPTSFSRACRRWFKTPSPAR